MKTVAEPRTRPETGPGLSSAGSGLISIVETLFVAAAVAFVYSSYLTGMPSFYPWLGLAAAAAPLLLRLRRQGCRSLRTPFDIPIAIIVAGGIVGLAVSPLFRMSLGAFQTLLALACLYYSVAASRHPATLMKVIMPLFFLFTLAATVFALGRGHLPPDSLVLTNSWLHGLVQGIPKLPQVSSQPNLAAGANHGLALALLMVAAICAGLAVFGRRLWLRIGAGLGVFVFLIGGTLFINSALFRLMDGESLDKRLAIWQNTVQALKENPLTGLGLGGWAPLFNPKGLGWMTSHPHNTYLSLYSDFGILGVIALAIGLFVFARLAWGILRTPRGGPWYGFGLGVVLAAIAVLLTGIMESAPAGIPLVARGEYFFVISPAIWMAAAFLVAAHRLTSARPKVKRGTR